MIFDMRLHLFLFYFCCGKIPTGGPPLVEKGLDVVIQLKQFFKNW